MEPDKSGGFRLSPKALQDIEDIWRYTAETWSLDQPDRYIDELNSIFLLLVRSPKLGHQYSDIDPPVHIHVHKSHLIIYLPGQGGIVVLRVLGGRQNWHAILKAIDP